MTSLETLATIIIALGIIKIFVIMVSAESWLNFAKKIYAKPKVTSIVALLLAILVLKELLQAGLTIIDIFAVMLFLSLIIIATVANYMPALFPWVKKRGLKKLLQEQWLTTIIWVILLLWGLKELLV